MRQITSVPQLQMVAQETTALWLKEKQGDAFRDRSFDPAESTELALRAWLMAEIRRLMERTGLARTKSANFIGIGQPGIGNIMTGRVDEMSLNYRPGCCPEEGRIQVRV